MKLIVILIALACCSVTSLAEDTNNGRGNPELVPGLEPFRWLIGEWKVKEVKFWNDDLQLRSMAPMKAMVGEKGNAIEIEIVYSYSLIHPMLPFPFRSSTVSANETLRWNSDEKRFELSADLGKHGVRTYHLLRIGNDHWEIVDKGQRLGVIKREDENRISRWLPFDTPNRSPVIFSGERTTD